MEPTNVDHLIALLLSARSTKIYRKILWSRVRSKQENLNIGAFNQHIYRLRKNGLIKTNGDAIYFHRKDLLKFSVTKNSVMKNVFPSSSEKVLISFDIPETKKKIRDWLRNQIRYWEFEMIHKSLWLGGGPLPKEFYERITLLGVRDNIRIFRIRKTI